MCSPAARLTMILAACAFSCDTTDPPPPPPPPSPPELRIEISAEEVGVDDIVLRLSFPDSVPSHSAVLFRDGAVVWNGLVAARDTTVLDSMLQPATTYVYRAKAVRDTSDTASTSPCPVTTLDTTTHQFVYEIREFGEFNSCNITGVAILREDLAYAVGEIYMRDSLGGHDPEPYNFLRWDGSTWHLSKARALYPWGLVCPPIFGISVLAENEIWVTTGHVWRWDGQEWTRVEMAEGLGYWTAVWARSSSEVYFGTSQGQLAYYDGTSVRYPPRFSTLFMDDIWGMTDGNVLAAGSSGQTVTGVVLRGRGVQWGKIVDGVNSTTIDSSELWRTKVYGMTSSVWCDERYTGYAAGSFLYRYKNGRWGFVNSLPGNFLFGNPGNAFWGFMLSIRGNSSNDMVLVGERGTCLHFNGRTWRQIGPPYVPTNTDVWNRAAMRGNVVVVGGRRGLRATLMVLRRQ